MKNFTKTTLIFLLMYTFSSCNHNNTDYYKTETHIDSIIGTASIPMIQLAYTHNNKTQLFEATHDQFAPPAAPGQSVFQAASLSKTIFAYIVLKMAEKGQIDLDKPLSNYLEPHRIDHSQKDWANALTAKIVLSHRSGLPNWSISPSSDLWPDSKLKFRFKPDSTFSYSGEAYFYLQQVIEKISNKPLEQLAREIVFIPLGMNSTSYQWGRQDIPSLDYDSIAVDGFDNDGVNQGKGRHPRANCAYTLRTTASDYSKFLCDLFGQDSKNGYVYNHLLKPATTAQRYPQQKRMCDNNIHWGLGIGIEENEQLGRIYFHWGDNGSFKALFIVVPSQNKHFVYFTNSARGHSIIDNITPLFFDNTKPLALSAWINEPV
jgi:CubicO group peptidase (beta-lactamase class C family)